MNSNYFVIIVASIGLVADIIAIIGFLSQRNETHNKSSKSIFKSRGKLFYGIVFVSASWVLLVVTWFLGFEPYSAFLTDREIKQLIAIFMVVPVIMMLLLTIKFIVSGKNLT